MRREMSLTRGSLRSSDPITGVASIPHKTVKAALIPFDQEGNVYHGRASWIIHLTIRALQARIHQPTMCPGGRICARLLRRFSTPTFSQDRSEKSSFPRVFFTMCRRLSRVPISGATQSYSMPPRTMSSRPWSETHFQVFSRARAWGTLSPRV